MGVRHRGVGVLVIGALALTIPAASSPGQADEGQPCPPNNETGAPTLGHLTFTRSPVPVGAPVSVAITEQAEFQDIRLGSLVFTIVGPDGSHRLAASGDLAGVVFTPAVAGEYTATARYQVTVCSDPARYADATAGPAGLTAVKPVVRKPVLPEDSGAPNFTVKASEVPRVARKWGFLAPHRLPTGTRGAAIARAKRFIGGPPGTPTPAGVFVAYGPGASNPPQLFVFRHKSLASIRKVVLAHDNGYKKQGGSVSRRRFRAGRFSGETVNVGPGGPGGYVEYLWHKGAATYLMTLLTHGGKPAMRGVTATQIIASFR